MKATGIVRRIDELGRVVIPKEIRKTLRIKEGDPLEIYTDRDELIFKKYSPLASIDNYAESVAQSLANTTEKTVFICDTDSVICGIGSGTKEIVEKNVSDELGKLIRDKKSLVCNEADGGAMIEIAKGVAHEFRNILVIPVISDDMAIGAIVLADKKKEGVMGTIEIKMSQLASDFLSGKF